MPWTSIYDVTEQDEIEAGLVYARCAKCGNQYISSILPECPICKRQEGAAR